MAEERDPGGIVVIGARSDAETTRMLQAYGDVHGGKTGGEWHVMPPNPIEGLRNTARMLLSGKDNLTLDVLANAMNTDETTVEQIMDQFGSQVMQRKSGRETEFKLWDALPPMSRMAWRIGKSEWAVREAARLEN